MGEGTTPPENRANSESADTLQEFALAGVAGLACRLAAPRAGPGRGNHAVPPSPAVPERAVPVAADKSGHSLTARHWAHRPGGPTAGAWGEEGQSPATSEPAVCGPTSGRGLRETCPARAPRTSEADQCCGPRCEFTCTATHKQDGGESRSSHTRARPPVADCSPGKPCCLQEKAAGLC